MFALILDPVHLSLLGPLIPEYLHEVRRQQVLLARSFEPEALFVRIEALAGDKSFQTIHLASQCVLAVIPIDEGDRLGIGFL